MGVKDSHQYLKMEAECAHHGIREILDGAGRRRWQMTCGQCGKSTDYFRSDLCDAPQIINHFKAGHWILKRKTTPYCSKECAKAARQIEMEPTMSEKAPVPAIGPNPVIMRRVITLLNDQLDMDKRLYRAGYSDERVAKEAETSLEFVVSFRRSAYCELAEDPMISQMRGEVAALKGLFEEEIAKLRAYFEPQIKEVDYKLARLIGTHKAAG